MSQNFGDMSAFGYYDDQYPYEPKTSRPLRDYFDPLKQNTCDFQSNIYNEIGDWCALCECSTHKTDDCPVIPAFKEVLYGQSDSTYTHEYEGRNYQGHLESRDPTFDAYPYLPHPQPYQSDEGSTFSTYQSLDDTFDQFLQSQWKITKQMAECQEQTIRATEDIKEQLTQLTQTLSVSESGEFPTQPNQKLIDQCLGEEPSSRDTLGHDMVYFTPNLRNDEPFETFEDPRTEQAFFEEKLDRNEIEAWEEKERKREEKRKDIIDETQFGSEPFVPKNLTITYKDPFYADSDEVFEQVEFIVPLVEIIQQICSITKFFNEWCALQRKLHEFEMGVLEEQISAILPSPLLPRVGVG